MKKEPLLENTEGLIDLMENSVKWYITRKIMVILSQVCLSLIILYKTTKNFLLLYDSEFIFYSSEGSTISLTTIALETLVVVLTIAALSMFFVEIIRSHAGIDFQSILRIFLKLLFLYAAGGLFVLILLDRVDLMEQIVSLFLVKAIVKKMDQYLDKKEKERLVRSGYFQLQRKTETSELSINLGGIDSIEHQEKISSSVEYLYQFKYYPFTLVVANSDSSDPKFIDSGEAAFTRLFLVSLTVYFSFLFAVNGEYTFYLPGIVALLFLWIMRKDTMLLINSCKERLTKIKRNRG